MITRALILPFGLPLLELCDIIHVEGGFEDLYVALPFTLHHSAIMGLQMCAKVAESTQVHILAQNKGHGPP